jgi:hypothetical protein
MVRKMKESDKIRSGGMGEWLKPAVLKTVSGVTRSGVRIPLPPLHVSGLYSVIYGTLRAARV